MSVHRWFGRPGGHLVGRTLPATVLVALVLWGTPAVAHAASVAADGAAVVPVAPVQTAGTVRALGMTNLGQAAALHRMASGSTLGPAEYSSGVEIPKAATGGNVGVVPNPPTTPISSMHPGETGVDAISHLDQRLASNGNQQSLEPPDQGLCVGSGQVVEAVNVALAVYSANGFVVEVPVTALSDFFGLAPGVNRQHNPPTFGPFLSDPRCYFDAQTKRFYLTVLEIDRDPFTGALGNHSATLIAVSQSSNASGAWALFSVDATDDGINGTPRHPNCPCFGDQPVIGADANGFYFSTNEYSLHPFGTFFNGAQIYALSKRALAAAAPLTPAPRFVHLEAGNLGMHFPPVEGIPAAIASVQPASTPPGGAYARHIEYFLSSFDVNVNKGDHRIALWALSNTDSLDAATPKLKLTADVLQTEPYAGGPPAGTPVRQKAGPRPLGQAAHEPLPTINADDDRMQAPTYVNGHLFTAISTGVGPGGTVDRTGVAWFVVNPTFSSGQVAGTVANQGYVAAGDGTSLMYPFVTVNPAGQGVIALSFTGPQYYPSFGYIEFGAGGPSGPVRVARPGALPEDGFTCYVSQGFGPPCRWGDYSYAVTDEAGHLWIAGEDIPNSPRWPTANWGTFVGVLKP
ncbi:MAG: hypothetical protein QOE57_256 [Acidimicrobiaceae bacterium]|nr:hypothetical protein [Acidimicrobiaceae bacterium]